jgi:methionyl-tRNA formyltransferase
MKKLQSQEFCPMTKVVFFGNERLVSGLSHTNAPVLNGLIDAGYDVVAIVAHHDNSTSRTQRKLEVADVASSHNIPILLPDKPVDILPELSALNADIGILVAYGCIVSQSIIDIFPHGIINLHPSLLPQYRGSTPIEAAVLNGDKITGISLMQLIKEIDAGPVYAQESIDLTGHEDKFAIYERLSKTGTKMLLKNLPGILSKELYPAQQDDSQATYCPTLTKIDGYLNAKTMTATECDRKIRAFLGWPKTRLDFHNQEVIVTKAKVLGSYAGDDWPDDDRRSNETYLQFMEWRNPRSGKKMKTADYLRGLRV